MSDLQTINPKVRITTPDLVRQYAMAMHGSYYRIQARWLGTCSMAHSQFYRGGLTSYRPSLGMEPVSPQRKGCGLDWFNQKTFLGWNDSKNIQLIQNHWQKLRRRHLITSP